MKSFLSLLIILVVVVMAVTSLQGMQKNSQEIKRQIVKVGQDINEAMKVMSQAGIEEGLALAIVASEKNERLSGWPVISGHLVARYSIINNRIVSMALYLEDKDPRPRSQQTRDLVFKVNSYSPITGEMLLIVPNKSMKKTKR